MQMLLLRRIYHFNDFRIHRLCKDTSSGCDVFNQFIECTTFNFFAFEIRHSIHKIKGHAALPKFSDEQIFLLRWCDICNINFFFIKICKFDWYNYIIYDRKLQSSISLLYINPFAGLVNPEELLLMNIRNWSQTLRLDRNQNATTVKFILSNRYLIELSIFVFFFKLIFL